MHNPIQAIWAEDEEEDIGPLRKNVIIQKFCLSQRRKPNWREGEFCPFGEKSQKQGKTFAVI